VAVDNCRLKTNTQQSCTCFALPSLYVFVVAPTLVMTRLSIYASINCHDWVNWTMISAQRQCFTNSCIPCTN